MKDLELFQIVFSLFDENNDGYVSKQDVIAIAASLQKDISLVIKMLDKVLKVKNENIQDEVVCEDKVSFGEFATLIWQVQQYQLINGQFDDTQSMLY